jgi:colicin import membrane protein
VKVRWLLTLLLCLNLQAARAQPAHVAELSEAQIAAERQRIEAERQKGTEALAAEESACQNKFAVNDCVRPVQARKRALLADLKRQEVRLNDMERRQRAQAQRERILQRQQERAADDESRVIETKSAPTPTEKGAPRGPFEKPASSAPDAAAQAQNRAAYARKLEEAERHRRSLQRQNQEKPSTATTLPTPQ